MAVGIGNIATLVVTRGGDVPAIKSGRGRIHQPGNPDCTIINAELMFIQENRRPGSAGIHDLRSLAGAARVGRVGVVAIRHAAFGAVFNVDPVHAAAY